MTREEPLDFTLLETFHEVARTGSVTAAARALGRSQPAVSHRLRALEDELGVPLFERQGRRLAVTEWGRRLQHECVDLLARQTGLRERVRADGERVSGTIRLGTFPSAGRHLLLPAFASLLEHPDLRLDCTFALGDVLVERLRTGAIDVALLIGSFDATGTTITRRGRVRLIGVGPTGKARNERYLAWGGPADPTFGHARAYAEQHGLIGPATPSIPNIEALRALAAVGAGFTILPDYTVREDLEKGVLRAIDLPGLDIDIPVAVAVLHGRRVGPALRAVLAAVEAVVPIGPTP
jgi:DNA-binding transcriptional LysR family regulator